jgi:glutaminyl-peptide cyclotransferase
LFGFFVGCLFVIFETTKASGASDKIWTDFSGEKSLMHVQQLVNLGPRPPASPAIEKARDYIEKQLQNWGWTVNRQAFSDITPKGKIDFVNLLAHFAPRNARTDAQAPEPFFLLCSHYDTKTFDTIRFVGANDGGSSTGLLLELGRVLAERPDLAQKVELVFFDGEEAYENFTATDGLYGSRYFARSMGERKAARPYRGGILFDMVGKRDVEITIPPDSPAQIARDIFKSADALNVRNYFTYFDADVTDDHTPLNAAGSPVIDLIDFHYPPWHTAEDTMDKLSPESLQIVGSVALYYLANFGLK